MNFENKDKNSTQNNLETFCVNKTNKSESNQSMNQLKFQNSS